MTRLEFEKLPFLLRRHDVVATGISPKAINALLASGQLTCIPLRKHGQKYFHRAQLAKLLGFT